MSRIFYKIVLLIILISASFSCQQFSDARKKEYYEKGMKYFSEEKYNEASKEFKKALAFDSKYSDAMYMIGESFFRIADFENALPWFEKAMAEKPQDLKIKLKAVETQIKLKTYRLARLRIEEILTADPNNHEARIMRLKCWVERNNLIEAERDIHALMKDGETGPYFYVLLAQYNIKKLQLNKAEQIIEQHYDHSEDWLSTITILIDLYQNNGNRTGLEKLYALIIKHAPDKVPYQMKLAQCYRDNNDEQKEVALHQEMLKDNPENVQIKLNYLTCLIHYNKINQAETFLLYEIKKQPDTIDFKKALINFYAQTGKIATAIKELQSILKNIPPDTPQDYEMRNVLADLYFQAGDYSSSKKTSSNILNKSKNNADARFNLCRIDLKEGQLLAAIGGLRQLVSENPAVAHYKYYLGMAHELRGELLMAEDAYKQTLELAVDHKEALVKWASLHAKRARSSELKMRIEKYLAIHPYDKEISALHNDLINQGTTGIMLIEQN